MEKRWKTNWGYVAVAAAVDAVVVAGENEVAIDEAEVVGNNAALDGVAPEQYHAAAAAAAEAEAAVAKPVAAAGNEVVAAASVHRTHPTRLQTQ
jgi:hypothetical protein